MKRPLVILVLLILPACTAMPPTRDDDAPTLSAEERRIITALLQQEARHSPRPRPVLVLTPTDSWLPRYDDDTHANTADLPDDARQQVLEEERKRNSALNALRVSNVAPASLRDVVLPPGAVLFSAAEYKLISASKLRFDRFVRRNGGLEPLVLSVSRPALGADESLVVLRVDSTWSGCGGVNLFKVSRDNHVELDRVLVFW